MSKSHSPYRADPVYLLVDLATLAFAIWLVVSLGTLFYSWLSCGIGPF